MPMIQLAPQRLDAGVDVDVLNKRSILRFFSLKSEARAIIMTVNGSGCAKKPLILRRSEIWRHRLAGSGELEPVISFTRAVGIKRGAAFRRFNQMTSREFRIDVGKQRRNIDIKLSGNVFGGGRQIGKRRVIVVQKFVVEALVH